MTTTHLSRGGTRVQRFLRRCGVLAVLCLLGACGTREPRPAAGPEMPDFSLATPGGTTVTKADFRGKVVLFDFWATWCGPCHLQADILRDIYPEAAKHGVEFVALATGEDAETVRSFIARKPFPYPVLLDANEVLAGPLGIAALPTLVLMDRDGRIVWRHTGVAGSDAIEEALAATGEAGG